jgi:flagellar hook-associated protein 3 FlgL
MFTDLGGRQNQLTLLDNAHTDVSLANDQVVHDLSDTDWAATSMNMQLYVNSVQISNKAYSMVSQLSLFDTM